MAWLRRSSASAYPNDSASAVNSRSSSGRRRRASAESVLPTSSKSTSTDSRGKFRKPRLSAVPPRRQILIASGGRRSSLASPVGEPRPDFRESGNDGLKVTKHSLPAVFDTRQFGT